MVVEDLVYNSNAGLLFASTHGRGVWIASAQSNFSITVSASPAAGGNVCCTGSFPANTVQTVTASANKGYRVHELDGKRSNRQYVGGVFLYAHRQHDFLLQTSLPIATHRLQRRRQKRHSLAR